MVLCVVSTLKSLNLFNGSTSSQEITFVMSKSLTENNRHVYQNMMLLKRYKMYVFPNTLFKRRKMYNYHI